MKIFMVFLTMYYMSWGLGYFYENSQLEITKCNTIYTMRASDGRFISIESEFSNYLFYRNFFIFTYIMKIFMVFLTIYYMSWGLSYFYENSQLEIRKFNTIYAMRASDGRFISIESEFSNYLFYRKFFIFTYIMKIFILFLKKISIE